MSDGPDGPGLKMLQAILNEKNIYWTIITCLYTDRDKYKHSIYVLKITIKRLGICILYYIVVI